MHASDRVVAQRYAKALFEAARDKGNVDRVKQDLAAAAARLRDQMKAIQHPLISFEEKKKSYRKVLGPVSPLVENFLDLLIEKKRWSLLRAIGQGLNRLVDEHQRLVRAQARTALSLSKSDQEKLKRGLERFTGKKVDLTVRKDARLIGGLVVRMGDWIFDASLANRLSRLRERLT